MSLEPQEGNTAKMPDGGDDMQPAVHAPQPAVAGVVVQVGSNVVVQNNNNGLEQQPAAAAAAAVAEAVAAPAAVEVAKQPEAVAAVAVAAPAPAAAVPATEARVGKAKELNANISAAGSVGDDAASLLSAALGPAKPTLKPAAPAATVAAVAKPARPGASPAHVQGGLAGDRKTDLPPRPFVRCRIVSETYDLQEKVGQGTFGFGLPLPPFPPPTIRNRLCFWSSLPAHLL